MSNIIYLGDGVLKELHELPNTPGIYKFLNEDKEIIYIGKAKDLSRRTKSYFSNLKNKTRKLKTLISETHFLDITITSTELEALLLEQHSIKQHRPKFNVQFKDDKGYPWIVLEISKEYPSAKIFLGRKKKGELYFGPFPSSRSARESLSLIQKVFKLRDCTDSFFKNRSRPCMQYQIGKCSAPCVSAIRKGDYLQEVNSSKLLLQGKGEELIKKFYKLMDKNADKKLYERASSYRDKISSLRDIQRGQSISGFSKDRDALAVHTLGKKVKVGVTSVRGGWIVGHENFNMEKDGINETVIEAFLSSHYLFSTSCPPFILVEGRIENKETIQKALSKKHNKKIKIISKPSNKDLGLLNISSQNTKLSLKARREEIRDLSGIFKGMENLFQLKNKIKLIESYDVSHFSGQNAVAGGVAFNVEGSCKDMYRIYNISKVNSGDDIASLKEIMRRRFSSKSKKNVPSPDLILIDGGYIHLKSVKDELDLLGIVNQEVISISKGSRRKPEMDSIHKADGSVVRVERSSEVHLFLQEIRDETHRFSITTQRKKESKSSHRSILDSIRGVGTGRKASLLRYFGSVDQITRASIQDLCKVKGIGKKMANIVYRNLH